MRQYVVDELRKNEMDRVRQYLERYCEQAAGINRLYWLQIPDELLSSTQLEHASCAPFCVGIETTDDSVIFEMLVRSRQKLRCSCIAYASEGQRQFILGFADRLLRETEIGA